MQFQAESELNLLKTSEVDMQQGQFLTTTTTTTTIDLYYFYPDTVPPIGQLPTLCMKISILRHRRMWVRSFSTRLTSVTFAEDKVLIFLILLKNAKIVQL